MSATDRSGVLSRRFDFGVRARARSWGTWWNQPGLGGDFKQGLVLAASTLPLAIYLSSLAGAPASAGILTAAVGSAVCVFLGGTRSGLSGPGFTTAFTSSVIIARHGLDGMSVLLVLAGLLQVVTGALGIGRLIRFVPLSVLRGFVLGMGVVMLLWQLPLMVGAPINLKTGVLTHLDVLVAHVPKLDPAVGAVGLISALLAMLGLRYGHIPGAFLALVVATLGARALGIALPAIHEASSFPLLHLPRLPAQGMAQLIGSAIELWGTMCLATAFSTAALDELDPQASLDTQSDPDQELIGNGIASVVLAFLNGLPATQLIARSALAVRPDVRPPVHSVRPALLQAIIVLVTGLAAYPVLRFVPLAALTGIAISVALPLLDPRPLWQLGRASRSELWIGIATVLTMVFAGIVTGLLLGLAISFGAVALKIARTRALVHRSKDPLAPHQVSFSGPITFLAALELEQLRAELGKLEPGHGLVLDLRNVVVLDGNGAIALVKVLDEWRARTGRVALLGPTLAVREKLLRADETPRLLANEVATGTLKSAVAANDRELDGILGKPCVRLARPRLLAGITRFREETRDHYDSLFTQLADGQHPHTMFITCADSRIDPSLLIGAHPGDLFTVRAIGALVARSGDAVMPQEGAAIEYGVGVLGVRTIIVCGHSKCGAISALKNPHLPPELTTLELWSRHAAGAAGEVASFATADDAARAVTVRQLDNLLSYPLVRARHASGELQIHAWFYDLGKVELFEWDVRRQAFNVLGAELNLSARPPSPIAVDAE